MSQSPEKSSEPVADLPNPELNPLLNPVLSRHLGQWAHVYFTTAPEEREDALFELLAELEEKEARDGVVPVPTTGESDSNDAIYGIVCPHCQRSNVRSQKYCGMCGSLMPVRAQAAAAATGGSFGEALFSEAPAPLPQEGVSSQGVSNFVSDVIEEMEPREHRGAFTATSLLFQPEPVEASSAQRPPEPVDIDWLRERNTPVPATSPGSLRTVTYVFAMVVLICGAIVLSLHFQRGGARGSRVGTRGTKATEATSNDTTPAATQGAQNGRPQTFDKLPRAQSTENQLRDRREEARTAPKEHTFSVAPQTPPGGSSSDATLSAASDPNQNGAGELAAAKDYLSGRKGPPDGGAAAKLLWRAVAKQNGEALVMLSDLYAAGSGVPKNCDQAKLLLDAALRKNIPTAEAKLRYLQKSCP